MLFQLPLVKNKCILKVSRIIGDEYHIISSRYHLVIQDMIQDLYHIRMYPYKKSDSQPFSYAISVVFGKKQVYF
jgi:hypothetical protein